MSDQQISLKTVDDLRLDPSGQPQRFFVAAYQRGYRWAPLQVTQLLDDIREFMKRRNPQPEEFYCLQPLVLKNHLDGAFEVVDGQQRLTTLLLILRHLNKRLTEEYRQPVYSLDYETRPHLAEFLRQPSKDLAESNADFFHLGQAIQAIEEWFRGKEGEVGKLESALLKETKVIWFQLADRENAVAAFTRLNVGKIPLTNDELIRALFLRRTSAEQSEAQALQLQIAHEWDQLEKVLQLDAFWYFLNNEQGKPQNRIGFLFDLVARSEGLPPETQHDDYAVFYAFSQKLSAPGASPEQEWLRIKKAFLTVEEWFEDRVLYHMVGFLVAQRMGINEIRQLSANCTKTQFADQLRHEIFRKAVGSNPPDPMTEASVRERVAEQVEALQYRSNDARIKSVLLLFNLATLLQNSRSNIRFQFDSFKNQRWDIEHVRSVASEKPERHSDRVDWLKQSLGYLRSQNAEAPLQEQIEVFLKLRQTDALDVFDPLYAKVLAYFQEDKEEAADNGIANLALLDEYTNRSYQNAVFAVKRKRLLELDQAGIFVPLCTRNVFLKCYNPKADNMLFWTTQDREAYRKAIIDTLVNFFLGRMEGIE